VTDSVERTFYSVRSGVRVFSKYAVGLRAAKLLTEGSSLLIDAGTSLSPIAKIVRKLADVAPDETHYTIMTHNNEAFLALSDARPGARLNVFQTGGRYDRDLNASFGHQAELAYLRFHPRWVFLGQNGLEADLGLFCHGNTEELALKREIFAMPAWGRVVLSDYTKIGAPGGLLFGDSSNLTTNVEECLLITDDIHDAKFKRASDKRGRERFETQVRLLKETYGVRVELVHYSVLTPENVFVTLSSEIDPWPEEGTAAFRLWLTYADAETRNDFDSVSKEGYVDLTLESKENRKTVRVMHVDIRATAR
jgi:DeoR/GlpR family transcriptional regulator of sugar metabolism